MNEFFEGLKIEPPQLGYDDVSLEQSKMSFVMRFSAKNLMKRLYVDIGPLWMQQK